MRTRIYITALAFFTALLVAFATTPSVAEMASNPEMRQPGMAGQHQGQIGKKDMGFGSEAKSGMEGQGNVGFSGEMKGEAKGELGKKPEGFVSGEARTGMPKKGAAGMKGRGAAAKQEFPAASKGGEAIVFRVDRPDNCLRVRSGPSASTDRIACVGPGESVHLTGVFSPDGRWAQLDNKGWVFFDQLRTDVKPPESVGRSWKRPAGAGGGRSGRSHRHGSSCFYGGYYYPYPYS